MRTAGKSLGWLAVGILLGIAIWLFSPWITGRIEPWDSDFPIWQISWLVVAVLGSLAGHARGVCLPLGYALGQMLVTIKSAFVGQFGALGWMFIAGYAAAATILTLVIVAVTMVWRQVRRPPI
ncbi:MAG: hypothetical protein KIT36_00165 [Alphaproteobacteria bacterium]|nr:hypothetical protein [Alphaproteobacteria bacterium]